MNIVGSHDREIGCMLQRTNPEKGMVFFYLDFEYMVLYIRDMKKTIFSQQSLIHKLQSDDIRLSLRDFSITKLWLIGSYSRDEQRIDSDVDLIYMDDDTIVASKPRGVFGAIDMLQQKLKKNVDLIHTNIIARQYMDKSILSNAIELW